MKIPTVFKDECESNFSGCCNIRIYYVRFGFDGLRVVEGKEQARVSVGFRHSGEEEFVDRYNGSHKFVHEAITTMYSFILDPKGQFTVQNDGNIGMSDVGDPAKTHAAPGPFADNWEIDLHNSQLDRLDFSNVTKAYFDFCGTNYSFSH